MARTSRSTPATPRRRGRPAAGSPDTRAAVLEAARRQFADLGYDRATVRGIAAEAGVDPKMVGHHFGSKQRLFLAVVEMPIDPAALLPQVLASPDPPRSLAEIIAAIMESPDYQRVASGLVRAAASEPEAAPVARELLVERLLLPFAERLGTDEPQLRAELLASQVAGLVLARFVLQIEPLARIERDRLADVLAPVVRRYLVDPL